MEDLLNEFSKYNLTKREIEVSLIALQGLSAVDSASKLFVSHRTFKFHLTNIYKKTDVKSRSQFIVKFSKFKNNSIQQQTTKEETKTEEVKESVVNINHNITILPTGTI